MERSTFELGLSNEEALEIADTLDALTKHAGWKLLVELVKAARIQAREAGFARGKDEFDWWQGYVEGIGLAVGFPAAVRDQARKVAVEEVKRTGFNPLRGGAADGDLT